MWQQPFYYLIVAAPRNYIFAFGFIDNAREKSQCFVAE